MMSAMINVRSGCSRSDCFSYFQNNCFQFIGDNNIAKTLNKSPTLVRAGLGAGRIIGLFLQLFETLPQPLPELREGGY